MALSEGDYGGAFGPFDSSFDPAMARVLATSPEALIPHLAAHGIPPPGPQFAENFAPRFDAAFPAKAPQGEIIPPAPASAPFVPGTEGVPSYQGTPSSDGKSLSQRIEEWGTRQVPQGGAPPPKKSPTEPSKAPDRVAPSEPGRVPPTALGKSEPVAPLVPDTGEEPYTPSPRYATVTNPASAGRGSDETAATPTADPRKAAPAADEESLSAKMKQSASALAGVKMPPAPPTPQLRPYGGERPNPLPQNNALIALLSQAISGGPQAGQALRLLQAVGGK